MKKILLILLGIVTVNLCAFAIESDFKNSLLKVDYVKTGADSYNIRLYTQKPYNEPIKVIKKTNTSYYILLPETFHSVGSVAPIEDIKNTEVKLFPYAGQDLNNGYTKISIYTSKPLNIQAQLNSSTKSVAPSINSKDLAKLDSAFSQGQSTNEQTKLKAQQEAQRQAQLKAQQEAKRQAQLKAQQEAQRQAQLKAQEEARKAEAQRQAQLKAQQEAQRQAQVQKTPSNNLQVSPEAEHAYYEIKGHEREQGGDDEKKSQTESDYGTPEDFNGKNVVTQDINDPNDFENIPGILDEEENKISFVQSIKDGFSALISGVKPYYYVILDNFILFITLAIAFIGIIMLIALNKTKKKGTSKTMDKEKASENKESSSLEELSKEINETYKTGLEEELSNKAQQEAQAFKDEFRDLIEEEKTQTAPVEREEFYEEPKVLSSVEIAPKRGFMIIETDGTKALFGYIYDNVFLLYQFREFISDYDIKFRISEKQYDRTFFIVKIDKIKLLVKVTNTSMRLELEM